MVLRIAAPRVADPLVPQSPRPWNLPEWQSAAGRRPASPKPHFLWGRILLATLNHVDDRLCDVVVAKQRADHHVI
jgi:hypothetical protein